jgi:cysteine desulfurase/selenocysteine lyase
VAESYGRRHVGEGDEIIISIAEHHSNLLPWQRLAQENGALLKYVYLDETGMFDMEQFRQALTDRTKIVAVTQVSNVTGIEFPVAEIVRASHDAGAVVVVDAAQSAPHIPIDVQALGADSWRFPAITVRPDGRRRTVWCDLSVAGHASDIRRRRYRERK